MKHFLCDKCKNTWNDDGVCEKCHVTNSSIYPTMFSKNDEQESDPVNHPSHYETGKFECIEVMKEVFGIEAVQNFCLLNAFKYLYRCEHKANKEEDIKKANWYITKRTELEEEKHGKS